ncbi:MAG: hypothetical protein ABI550_08785, partial [Ignavibacteriaceae bacterium]
FDWAQSYQGKAPDVGAYENEELVEGPPFRFLTPPNGKINYREKPRIVRHEVKENKLIIYFSEKINPASIQKDDLTLFDSEKEFAVSSISVTNENYAVTIEANGKIIKENLSISFKKMPVGMNGEKATYWASTIKIER